MNIYVDVYIIIVTVHVSVHLVEILVINHNLIIIIVGIASFASKVTFTFLFCVGGIFILPFLTAERHGLSVAAAAKDSVV